MGFTLEIKNSRRIPPAIFYVIEIFWNLLFCACAGQNNPKCAQNDINVRPKADILDVEDVVLDFFADVRKRFVVTMPHLGHARNARFHV